MKDEHFIGKYWILNKILRREPKVFIFFTASIGAAALYRAPYYIYRI